MLLQDVDEKINTNMREEAFSCRRKCAMTSSGSRILQRRNACDRICTPGVCASKVGPDEYRTERDATENGSTVAPQRKTFNINEDVRRRVPRHRNTDVNDVSSGCVCTCPVICIDSTKETRPSVTVSSDALACEDDEFAVIRLSLRKPRRWKWKLTTCASSPAVILLDERGDLLIDTAMRPGTPVDNNGNDTGVQPSRRTQRNGWEQRDICAEYREGDRLRSRKITERPVRDFEQKQKDDLMKSVSLREGLRSMIPQRSGPETRGRSLDASVRSTSTQSRSASDVSVKDRRLSPRSKARRHFVLRRRNCADSSTSSDSSSDVSATTARRGRTTGRTVFCSGHAHFFFSFFA
ncbi:hypothetical protein L798_06551 [Zootermopsis nevadensis]|uniref:Uncharacterized protein n=1 Tax=Zootermopsis nevadensis TaxID=136037 RepID=A0A067R5W7_ZOONE|nr:hypothetical protein L798_06551 [Zootermopsis nevadensis]